MYSMLVYQVAGILQPFLLEWRSVMLRMMGWEMTVMASSLVSTMNCSGSGGSGERGGAVSCCQEGDGLASRRAGAVCIQQGQQHM